MWDFIYIYYRHEKGSNKSKTKRSAIKSKDWIVQKKELRRRRGKEVKTSSIFTGRKRPTAF